MKIVQKQQLFTPLFSGARSNL